MKKILIFILAAIALTSCAGTSQNSTSTPSGTELYGTVSNISGNEVILQTGTLNESATTGKAETSRGENSSGKNDADAAIPFDTSNMPMDGSVTFRTDVAPNTDAPPNDALAFDTSNAPDKNTSQNANASLNGTASDNSSKTGTEKRGQNAKSATVSIKKDGNTKTITLPVNTKVYLKLGEQNVETTFANIQANDILKIILDGETPLQVEILGQENADG